MIDVHIIPTPTFEASRAEMVQDLQHPLIKIHIGEHIVGNLLEARWRAYMLGSSPYVSFADDDDKVLDLSWIERAVEVLESNPDVSAVYPRERIVAVNGRVDVAPFKEWTVDLHAGFSWHPAPHHLTIMRRHAVIELLDDAKTAVPHMIKNPERYVASGLVRYGRLVAFPDIAYEWRLRNGSARFKTDPPEVRRWVSSRALEDMVFAKRLGSSNLSSDGEINLI